MKLRGRIWCQQTLSQINSALPVLYIKKKVLLTSASGALFKHTKTSNYSLEKSNISIFNALITCIFINTCYL